MGIIQISVVPPERAVRRSREPAGAALRPVGGDGRRDAPCGDAGRAVSRAIGTAAAGYLTRALGPRSTVGFAWGSTLLPPGRRPRSAPPPGRAGRADHRRPRTAGCGHPRHRAVPPPLARPRLPDGAPAGARHRGGRAHPRGAPVWTSTSSARSRRSTTSTSPSSAWAPRHPTRSSCAMDRSSARPRWTACCGRGAVGDIALRFFDAEGCAVRVRDHGPDHRHDPRPAEAHAPGDRGLRRPGQGGRAPGRRLPAGSSTC